MIALGPVAADQLIVVVRRERSEARVRATRVERTQHQIEQAAPKGGRQRETPREWALQQNRAIDGTHVHHAVQAVALWIARLQLEHATHRATIARGEITRIER